VGFAAAANQGIVASTGEFVLLVNPDVSFGPGFTGRLVSALEAEPAAGSAAPKLVRPDGRIDSAGLSMLKCRKAVDRGSGDKDTGQFDVPARVFGACGAAAMYRRAALEDSRVMGEYFDEAFFAYKEDVDLAWRMNLLGWKCVYVPGAKGTHMRGWKAASRKDVPRFIRRHSFKNHYLTIMKNDDAVNMLVHLPWVMFYDIQLFFYALFMEPFLLGSLWDIIKLMPDMTGKRDEIMARRKVGPAGIRCLFG
ncbi:MAG TPA: glycosyltransferase, partial [Nitrospirota bacterium]